MEQPQNTLQSSVGYYRTARRNKSILTCDSGCDGVKSKTRHIVLGEDNPATHPQFTGVSAYRGLIPMDDAAKLMGDDLARNSQMFLGKNGHILTFPIEHGATMNGPY